MLTSEIWNYSQAPTKLETTGNSQDVSDGWTSLLLNLTHIADGEEITKFP